MEEDWCSVVLAVEMPLLVLQCPTGCVALAPRLGGTEEHSRADRAMPVTEHERHGLWQMA